MPAAAQRGDESYSDHLRSCQTRLVIGCWAVAGMVVTLVALLCCFAQPRIAVSLYPNFLSVAFTACACSLRVQLLCTRPRCCSPFCTQECATCHSQSCSCAKCALIIEGSHSWHYALSRAGKLPLSSAVRSSCGCVAAEAEACRQCVHGMLGASAPNLSHPSSSFLQRCSRSSDMQQLPIAPLCGEATYVVRSHASFSEEASLFLGCCTR